MNCSTAFRRKEMSLAYRRGYGGKIPDNDEQIKLWKLFKEHHTKSPAEIRKECKGYENQPFDLFVVFFYETEELIIILKEITKWSDCRVKTRMLKASRERLTYLRDLIEKWLNQQSSTNLGKHLGKIQ